MSDIFLGNPPDYVSDWILRQQPFCIEALEPFSFQMYAENDGDKAILYSFDNETYTETTVNELTANLALD